MSETTLLACPISAERINENAARTVAVLVVFLTLTGLISASWPLFLLLALDFALRAFSNGRFSLLRFAAIRITRLLNIPEKPIDAAPKKFAAGVGLVFSLGIALLLALNWPVAAWTVGGILLICALLEGAFGFCLGCVVYSMLVVPFSQRFSK